MSAHATESRWRRALLSPTVIGPGLAGLAIALIAGLLLAVVPGSSVPRGAVATPPSPTSVDRSARDDAMAALLRAAVPDTEVVRKGDSLWTIARRATGHGEYWPAVAYANHAPQDTVLQPGRVMVIPRSDASR